MVESRRYACVVGVASSSWVLGDWACALWCGAYWYSRTLLSGPTGPGVLVY